MPTYDYACPPCGYEWELFQSMKDDPIKTCPKCKKDTAQRLIGGGAGLIFKGSGFYETDFKAKSGTPPKSEAAAKSADKKPAAKADS